ncbi:expressed unknown protein [Seminavis robusta]|uniref:Uncharacterized protein n=1 Tax=Seminavis robusta TaxID=568900 RepID=A0A9N8E521_9STRA|nr:expressed unknown protein [Seminavis robusta]|eukprot:Sro659_g182880.1 n/a (260) ;mRNA; r:11599-12529
MLAFMAYPPNTVGTTAPSTSSRDRIVSLSHHSSNNSTTSSNHSQAPTQQQQQQQQSSKMMEMEGPPESMLSIATESAAIHLTLDQGSDLVLPPNNNLDHSVIADPPSPQPERRRRTHLLEKLYENTVDGPCQTVTLCEVQHMDLFLNCQQPLSFLGFGAGEDPRNSASSSDLELSYHLPPSSAYGYINEMEEPPIPGAYAVPRGCEYCGATHTADCPKTCSRPRLYFQKKRPPFAKRDASLWDPDTDEAIPQYCPPPDA